MKVILLTDIKNIGRRGEIKEFPDGYVQNFLLPKNLAEVATQAKIDRIKNAQIQKEQKKEIQHDLLEKIMHQLHQKEITIVRKVNPSGGLFGSINEGDIQTQIKYEHGLHIPKESILIKDHIKHTGDHVIKLGEKYTFVLHVKGQ